VDLCHACACQCNKPKEMSSSYMSSVYEESQGHHLSTVFIFIVLDGASSQMCLQEANLEHSKLRGRMFLSKSQTNPSESITTRTVRDIKHRISTFEFYHLTALFPWVLTRTIYLDLQGRNWKRSESFRSHRSYQPPG
jgi:hypothetical protein